MLLLLLACHPAADLNIVATRDLGPLETTDAVKGRDGGYSVTFGDRSVWLYGDSILSVTGEDGSAWRDNSWSWTEDLDASDGITGFEEPTDGRGAPEEFFPETQDEADYNQAHGGVTCIDPCGAREILWPMDAVYDQERDRVLAFYVKIHGEPGAWNFFARGYGVAVWSDFDSAPERPVVDEDAAQPTLLFTDEAQDYGVAALIDGGWLYAYACNGDGWGKPCRVARVAPEDVLDRAAWSFWDGDDWQGDVDRSAEIFDGNAQITVSWSPALDRFVATHMDGVGDTVVLRTAPAPEGPWSDAVDAFQTEPAYGDAFTYCGLGHAEYARDGGLTQIISYFRSTGDWTGEIRTVEVEVEAR